MTTPEHTTDVLIAGGGPVGMGLAIELGQRGVRCTVVERYAEPQPDHQLQAMRWDGMLVRFGRCLRALDARVRKKLLHRSRI